jgi:hypothetical protein
MKQTAVEWLVEQLMPKVLTAEQYYHIEKSKEMEKEQITYCYDFVSSKICTQCDDFKTGDEYYNQTFKSEQ